MAKRKSPRQMVESLSDEMPRHLLDDFNDSSRRRFDKDRAAVDHSVVMPLERGNDGVAPGSINSSSVLNIPRKVTTDILN